MPREDKPIRWKTLLVLLAIAIGLGYIYRFTDLGKRPVHTDEAILAIKTQEYWKTGTFEYDPKDYHGPFLHHLTKWVAGFRGWQPDALTEEQVRWVVALCGLLLVTTPLLFLDVIGRTSAGVASLLLAVSPMMAYYSRYYIMEVPFVLLTALFISAMWQWLKSKNKLWLIPAGILLGLMHATKETFVLNIAALVAGYGVATLMGLEFETNNRGYGFRSFTRKPNSWWAWVVLFAAAALTSVWMFSNGFRDWQYVTESVRTYESYLGRSQGAGGHEKPWHYYLELFFWYRQGFQWSEALIGGLALIGMLNAFLDRRRSDHKRAFLVAFATYTLVLLGIYSSIPYKTPWSVLSVGYAFALLAGLGARTIFRVFSDVPIMKVALAILLGAGIYNLCHQTSLATDYSFPQETRYAGSDLHNPYAYSHTSTNLVELAAKIHQLAEKHPAGKAMPVQVIQSEQGWPLPWYLRDMTHVGYQADIPAKLDAAVIVVDADKEYELRKKLGDTWESNLWGLRPGITLALLVEAPLVNRHTDAASVPPPAEPTQTPLPKPAESSPSAPPSEIPAPAPTPAVPAPMAETPPPATSPAPGEPSPNLPTPSTAPSQPGAPAMPPTPPAEAATSPATPMSVSAVPSVSPPAAPSEAPADHIPPKAQLVEDEPHLVGPPYPVPAVAPTPN